ncbi:MAG TPA: restriction endonuclease subunit S [candidate division Zixibacteria bacterium]|nr:restriction endonuclease subunit S [candidate division Zixibacteria bacterium]
MSGLPKGWVETTLGEVAEIVMGQSPKGESYNQNGDGLPFYQGITEFTDKYVIKKTYTNKPTKIVSKNTILFSVRAPVGKVNIVNWDACIGRGNAGLVIRNGNQDFLYFLLKSIERQIQNYTSGTVFTSISGKELKTIPITIPANTEEQKAIAAVLSAFDDKIELLWEQNRTLGTLAQTIFKEWFVRFNFPDKDGKPYKDNGGEMVDSELGEVPKGWRVEQLGKELEVKRGGSPRPIKDYISDSGYRWLKISDATASSSPFIFDIKEHIKKEGLNKTTLLKSGSLVLSNSATPGIPKFLMVESCIHDGWLHFPKTSIFSYHYLYLFFKHIKEPLLQQGNGSVFKNLKTDILKSWNMVVPDTGTIVFLNEVISPIFEKIKNNTAQIRALSKTRDTLLPKLMSGELKVAL